MPLYKICTKTNKYEYKLRITKSTVRLILKTITKLIKNRKPKQTGNEYYEGLTLIMLYILIKSTFINP